MIVLFLLSLCINLLNMKPEARNTVRILTFLLLLSFLSSCFATRKKNRCGDCPKWKIEWAEILFK